MQYPYLENPQAWRPIIELQPDGSLLKTSSFFMVIAPQNQTEIKAYRDYKVLLRYRVSWMIRQWAEDQMISLKEVYQMIEERLSMDGIYTIRFPRTSDMPPQTGWDAPPEEWAMALIESEVMEEHWGNSIMDHFPISMESDPEKRQEIIEGLPYHSLEEWLIQFTYRGH